MIEGNANAERDAAAQGTLLSWRRCNNAQTGPGEFNDDSATRDSCGQVRKRTGTGDRGRGPTIARVL